jgi:hypothetical protein
MEFTASGNEFDELRLSQSQRMVTSFADKMEQEIVGKVDDPLSSMPNRESILIKDDHFSQAGKEYPKTE